MLTQGPTVCFGTCELMKFILKLFFSLLKLFLIDIQIYLLYDTLLYLASVTEHDVRYPHLAICLVHWLFQIAPSYFCDTFIFKKDDRFSASSFTYQFPHGLEFSIWSHFEFYENTRMYSKVNDTGDNK